MATITSNDNKTAPAVSYAEIEAKAVSDREQLLADMEAEREEIIGNDPNANNIEKGKMNAEIERQRWEADVAKSEAEFGQGLSTAKPADVELDGAVNESAPASRPSMPMASSPASSMPNANVSSPSAPKASGGADSGSSSSPSGSAAPSSGASGSGGTGGE